MPATIFAIVILFALLGFAQDFRAERAIAALKRMAVPLVRIRRDMTVQELPSLQLCPVISCCWRRAAWFRLIAACWSPWPAGAGVRC